jgi:hypothetical protein
MNKQNNLIYETNYFGSWVKVYQNRLEFNQLGRGSRSIPINQIASINLPVFGVMKIDIETTGGQKYSVPTLKKKEVREAILKAQSMQP